VPGEHVGGVDVAAGVAGVAIQRRYLPPTVFRPMVRLIPMADS
jgi:hypothetical protein